MSATQNRRRPPLSATETVRIIARLFDRYAIDRRPDRDRSRDGERFERVLFYAVRDGLIRLPPKRGAGVKVKDVKELVTKLKTEAKVI